MLVSVVGSWPNARKNYLASVMRSTSRMTALWTLVESIVLAIFVLWSTAFLAYDPIAQGVPLEDSPSPHSVQKDTHRWILLARGCHFYPMNLICWILLWLMALQMSTPGVMEVSVFAHYDWLMHEWYFNASWVVRFDQSQIPFMILAVDIYYCQPVRLRS